MPEKQQEGRVQANAKLEAIPNNLERHYLLWIDDEENVEIYGLGTGTQMAEIIGERDQHDGSTGEHGQGIRIVGSTNITIRMSGSRNSGATALQLLGRAEKIPAMCRSWA
jgi:hypothetical protein